MLTTILSVSIPAVGLIIVQIIISMKQQRVQDVRFDMTIREIKEEVARLERKQDKHKELIERVVVLEQNNKAQWRWIDEFKSEN